MTPYEIPLSPDPQSFNITLGTIEYQLNVYWNNFDYCWMLDIRNADGTLSILTGIPIVVGVDLLEQYAYLSLGGQLIAQTDGDLFAIPTYQNLGITGHLYFVTP